MALVSSSRVLFCTEYSPPRGVGEQTVAAHALSLLHVVRSSYYAVLCSLALMLSLLRMVSSCDSSVWCASTHALSLMHVVRSCSRVLSSERGVVELLFFCMVSISSRALSLHAVWPSYAALCSLANALSLFCAWCRRATLLRCAYRHQLTRSLFRTWWVELLGCVFSSAHGVVELLFCVVLVSSRALPHLV